jgi:hypothetical protein
VIARDDVHGTCDCPAFEQREGSLGDVLGDTVIIEDVPGDQDEVDLVFRGLGPELLDRLKPGLANSVARTFLESRDSHAEVEICDVQESYHL